MDSNNKYKITSIGAENTLVDNIVPLNECGLMSIGMKAPDFIATTTMGIIKMSDFAGKWVVFFSNSGAFGPVCTTEYIAFANVNKSFEERNAQLLALSINSNLSHLAWINEIYEEDGVIIPFPIISDLNGKIARQYGMISRFTDSTVAARNVIIIDPNQIVRTVLIYPATNGRNIPEVLRLLNALQTSDEYDVLTPANWYPSQPILIKAPETYEQIIKRKEDAPGEDISCIEWWRCYKDLPYIHEDDH